MNKNEHNNKTKTQGEHSSLAELRDHWQELVDLLRELTNVKHSWIMVAHDQEMEVLFASLGKNAPFEEGQRMPIKNLYCEEIVNLKRPLLIKNALEEEKWKENTLSKNGLICFYGTPLFNPDGEVFGTLCLINDRPDSITDPAIRLVRQFRSILEQNLKENHERDLMRKRMEERIQVEQMIGENEKKFRMLFENAPVSYQSLDAEGYLLNVNARWLEMFGYEKNEVLGRHIKDFIHPDMHQDLHDRLSSFIEQGNAGRLIYRMIRKDQKEILIEAYGKISHLPDGTFQYTNCILYDITERSKSEELLRRSESTTKTIYKAAPIGIGVVENRKFINVNDTFIALTGYSEDELIGNSVKVVYASDEEYAKIGNFYGQLEEEGIRAEETVFKRKDGSERIVYLSLSLLDASRSNSLAVFTALDVTDRKKAETRMRMLSTAMSQSPAAVVITNYEGSIEYVNQKFCRLTGYKKSEVISRNPNILKTGHTPTEVYNQMWKTIKEGENWRGEFLNKKKSGETYWAESLISPVQNEKNEVVQFISIQEDITDRKRMIAQLEEALQKTEELSNLKSSLLSNISHELRTPMNGIVGSASILKQMSQDRQAIRAANNILISSRRLMNTLNSLVDLALFEANELPVTYEPIDLNSMMEFLFKKYKLSCDEKGVGLELNIPEESVRIRADRRLLQQVIENLLDNAVKFTNEGKVSISYGWTENENEIRITVKDSGIGIDEQHKRFIFQEFRQVSEGWGRAYEGTGLGLSVAKKMIELMGGDISVESEVGKGSTFYVLLNQTKLPADDSAEKNDEMSTPAKIEIPEKSFPHLLIVEDNLINCEVTSLFLSEVARTESATNPEKALVLAGKQKFDAFIIDINLGSKTNGIMLMNQIKQMSQYKNVPFIAVTGYAMAGDEQKLLAGGFDFYLSKPFEQDELTTIVESALSKNFGKE